MVVEDPQFGTGSESPNQPAIVIAPPSDVQGPGADGQAVAGEQAESCVPPAAVFQDMARRLADDPEGFVDRYSSFGASAAVPLRNAVMAQPDLLPVVIDLIRAAGTGSERARQLAVGLGQASLLCAATAPNTALRFQEAILELQDEFVAQNFAAAAGDTGTGALGGGGSGAAGGPGGGGSPGLNASTSLGAFGAWTIGSAPQPDPSFRFQGARIRTIFETSSSSGIVSRTTP